MGACFLDGSCASGTVPCADSSLGLHCHAPPGPFPQFPFVIEQVLEEIVVPFGRRGCPGAFQPAGDCVPAQPRCQRYSSSQVLAPQGRLLRVQDRRTRLHRRRRGFFPNVCPPAMSATVSSSFIAIRRNVSLISTAAATGSGLPFGPCGFT